MRPGADLFFALMQGPPIITAAEAQATALWPEHAAVLAASPGIGRDRVLLDALVATPSSALHPSHSLLCNDVVQLVRPLVSLRVVCLFERGRSSETSRFSTLPS